MKKFLMGLAALLMASTVFSQTPALTQPQVLGCTNPAPATSGQATVFFSACRSPAFLPLTTTSVIASTSKTSPSWAHSLSGYLPTDKIVACPAGAIASGASCTSGGVDASKLIAVSTLPTFSVTPAVPVSLQGTLSWTPPTTYDDGSPLTDIATYSISEDGTQIGSVPAGTTSFPLGTLNVGDIHTFTVVTVNSTGLLSVPANLVYTVVKPKVPNSATNVAITVK